MSEHFIQLKCTSCGGKLDIYDDMERFSCGYCGAEMIAKRRGGTVSLDLIHDEVKKVRMGTDKTAAELAIVRLNNEISAAQKKQEKNSPSGAMVAAVLLAFATLICAVNGWYMGALGLGVLAGIMFMVYKGMAVTRDELEKELNRLYFEMDRQKKIVNG